MKVAMFPGQGSQCIGMGEKLFDNFPAFVSEASNLLGYSVMDLCSGKPPFDEGSVDKTIYSQPAIFLVSSLKYLQYKKSDIEICVGHSLGLISALFAAEAIDFSQGISIVKKRAELMDQAPKGAMAAIIGNDVALRLRSILTDNDFFDIEIANYNGAAQVVISGPESSVAASQSVIEVEGLRFIRLSVSGAFHSRLMEKARIEFAKYLMNFSFKNPKKDVISTINAETISADFMLEELTFQLQKPVRWYETVLTICRNHPTAEFLEFGPGSTLTNLNKYIIEK
jgi:[acyl-carrier-protein] S-malonyltransferase/trans-AT polyketide synthase/acyltransferase/oxidoreductase domain-containing protein